MELVPVYPNQRGLDKSLRALAIIVVMLNVVVVLMVGWGKRWWWGQRWGGDRSKVYSHSPVGYLAPCCLLIITVEVIIMLMLMYTYMQVMVLVNMTMKARKLLLRLCYGWWFTIITSKPQKVTIWLYSWFCVTSMGHMTCNFQISAEHLIIWDFECWNFKDSSFGFPKTVNWSLKK